MPVRKVGNNPDNINAGSTDCIFANALNSADDWRTTRQDQNFTLYPDVATINDRQ